MRTVTAPARRCPPGLALAARASCACAAVVTLVRSSSSVWSPLVDPHRPDLPGTAFVVWCLFVVARGGGVGAVGVALVAASAALHWRVFVLLLGVVAVAQTERAMQRGPRAVGLVTTIFVAIVAVVALLPPSTPHAVVGHKARARAYLDESNRFRALASARRAADDEHVPGLGTLLLVEALVASNEREGAQRVLNDIRARATDADVRAIAEQFAHELTP
jgi:hypothetical protein